VAAPRAVREKALDDVHDHDPHRRAALVRRDSLLDRQAAAQDRHAGAQDGAADAQEAKKRGK
jgi:hypothetical protein